ENAGDVTFSQLHGTTFADIDGDDIPDFIAGKRYWSHLDTHLNPDAPSAAVLYCFRTVRDANATGGARLNRSWFIIVRGRDLIYNSRFEWRWQAGNRFIYESGH